MFLFLPFFSGKIEVQTSADDALNIDTRSELRGVVKQSQRTSEMADARGPSYVKESQTSGADNEILVRAKRSSLTRRKECVNKSLEGNEELVKYMSKLPGYLQHIKRGEESFQSNVLNVGVLDWGRLEKWKHGRANGGETLGKADRKVFATATTSTSGVVPNESHRCKIDDQLPTCSNLGKAKPSRDLQHSVHGVRCTLEPELASRDSLNMQELTSCSNKSSGRNQGVKPRKSRRSHSNRESTSGLVLEMGNSGGSLGMKKNLGVRDKETQKKAGEVHALEAIGRAEESGKYCVEKLDREEKIIGGDSRAGLTSAKQEFSNIFLLRSRKQSRKALSTEPQMSLDDNMSVAGEVKHPLNFSDGINSSSGLRSHITPSSALSFDLERDSVDMILHPGADFASKKECFGGRRRSKTASRIFDQEMPEDESRKERHHSPSKRFSFSFGRLSKSFSANEVTADSMRFVGPSEDTIKSGSMRFDASVCPSQSSNLDNQNTHCRSRVSPLRRFLDPILKPKGSEHDLPPKARSGSSNPKPTNNDVPHKDTSSTQALFQLTIRNGIPLFQFVVDDNSSSSRSILGATMKSSDSSFKDDSVQYCTFYSVNEVKKKKYGTWLIHGHKEKHCGFVYNVIGQMRLCNSISLNLTQQNSKSNSAVIKESVLFDESEQLKERREVAAVVIKNQVEENYIDIEETSVIIPGGVHSFPEKGAPSPLISRWRSGGLCDCGGWDVGCKLHVLSNKSLLYKFNHSFKLYDQEESEQESGPALAMTKLKTGIYRVEFRSFVSPLQAFFVCVTVMTCASEAKTIGKSSSPLAPPLSPVGRV